MKNGTADPEDTLEAQLAGALFRHQCPSPDQLHLFSWRQLDADDWMKIEAHVTHCPLCRGEVGELRALAPSTVQTSSATASDTARADAPESDSNSLGQLARQALTEIGDAMTNLRICVARLVTPEEGAMASATLRAPGDAPVAARLLYETDAYDIDLVLQPTSPTRFSLVGQLLAIDGEAPVTGTVRLTPHHPHRFVSVGSLDRHGTFMLADLESDTFQLTLTVGARRIVIPEVTLCAQMPA